MKPHRRLHVLASISLCAVLCLGALEQRGWSDENDAPSSGARRWLQRISRLRIPDQNERNHPLVRAAFRDVVHPTSQATVRVLADGVQVALGTIVRSDGYILTKSSQLEDEARGQVECFLGDGRRYPAHVVASDNATDLALLKVEAENLPEVQWNEDTTPAVGSWLATAGLDDTPTAIGVVSAPVRAIARPPAVLGVQLSDAEQGALIGFVYDHSPADKAGLKVGDIVRRIDDQEMGDRESLIAAIGKRQPGDDVRLAIVRQGRSLSLQVTLGDKTRMSNLEQAELMDSLGGPLSKRRFGFPSVLQHDSVLRPRDCGGPVVDLDGKAVGINIARASRVASYALPAEQVQTWLQGHLARRADQVLPSRSPLEPVSLDQ